jgi:hypothetical protein
MLKWNKCYNGNSRANNTLFKLDQRLGMSFKELQRLGINEILPSEIGLGGVGAVSDPLHS